MHPDSRRFVSRVLRTASRYRRSRRGFILPLSVLLVIMLAISGLGFLQMDFIERRMANTQLNQQAAFYLANAGFQRARQSMKISDATEGELESWTTILAGLDPTYPADNNPDCRLCPYSPTCGAGPDRGCVILPFQTTANTALRDDGITPVIVTDGDAIISADVPFGETFDDGFYSVRAYNNEPGLTDTDQALTVRTLGQVNGKDKWVEVNLLAVSNVRLINCDCEVDADCPENVNGNPVIDPMTGREPACTEQLPFLDPPLGDPDNYYRNPDHFPDLVYTPIDACPTVEIVDPDTGVVTIQEVELKLTVGANPDDPTTAEIQSGTFYFIECDVRIQNAGTVNDIIVYSTEALDIRTGNTFNGEIMIGEASVRIRGGNVLNHMLENFPAIISGGGGIQADANVEVYGTVYSEGVVDFNSGDFHGVIIGQDVEVQGGQGALYTDDGNPAYYVLMPGVSYSDDQKTTLAVLGSWREDPVP